MLRRFAFGLGVVAAALHLGLAARWSEADEQFGGLAVAWLAALAVAYSLRRCEGAARAVEVVAGGALLAAAGALLYRHRGEYHTVHRVLPVLTGVALIVLALGVRRLLRFRAVLALLCVPWLTPWPRLVREHFPTLRATSMVAQGYLKVIGLPAGREGDVLVLPGVDLRVYEACSGKGLMAQLLVLAVLVLCLFETTWGQRLFLAASALAIGFLVNAARVATLGVLATRDLDQFAYWDDYLRGALVFPVIGAALALLLWWAVLRRRPEVGGTGCGSGPPAPA